jgi:hypothetical protein
MIPAVEGRSNKTGLLPPLFFPPVPVEGFVVDDNEPVG